MEYKKGYRIGTFIILSDPYWVQAIEAIVHANHLFGDELVILQPVATNLEMRQVPPQKVVDQILASSLDALITTTQDWPVISALLNEGLPVVCLAELTQRHPLLTVSRCLYPGGVMAGEFIGQKLGGRGHAVCVSAGLEAMPIAGQSRQQGFQDALRPYPEISCGMIQAYWDYATAYPALLEAFRQYPQHIDALFGVSDTLALAACSAAREMGKIDEHTILVGLNGDPLALAAVADGQWTATIDTASEALGAEAFRAAHRAAAGEGMVGVLPQTYQLIDRSNVAEIATRKLIAIADIPSHLVGYNRQQELERISQLEKSMEISRRVATLVERSRLVADIGQLISRHYGYQWMRILRWNEQAQALEVYEEDPSPAAALVPLAEDELLRKVFQTRESIFIADLSSSRRWRFGSEWAGVRARAVLPITAGEVVIGVLDLQSPAPMGQPTLETIGLELLATQMGIALQNIDLFQNLLQARQAAENANQLKTRLVANVGHEMRTPLNAILGFSQAIEKDLEAGRLLTVEDLRHDLSHIYRSGEHLMYMINDLLDLSRAEIGALSLYFEPVELRPLLWEVFQSFAEQPGAARAVDWDFDVPDDLPVIQADIIRLRQILMNLLSNAKKFTRQGKIRLGVRVEVPFIHLWVADTGVGVSLEMQTKIFEPFGSLMQKERPEGIGLGLSITRHLVSLHEGIITLESTLGAGSTFHVYLPLQGNADLPLSPSAEPVSEAIFVISEADRFPAELQAIAGQQKLPLVILNRKTDVMKALAESKPAAIAWDSDCPDPEEWLLINRIVSQPGLAALPVIFFNSEQDRRGEGAGLTHLVFKPNSVNMLSEWMEQVRPALTPGAGILIVDDDPEVRRHYRSVILKKFGNMLIHEVGDGRQAVEFLERGALPGLVLLDLMMPEMDGFKVLQKIRCDARTRQIPVIVMSGKLLDYQDVQRLDYQNTLLSPKGLLGDEELQRYLADTLEEREFLPQPTSQLVKKALAYIHRHYDRELSRKELADELGISVNYLTDIFRREMSISPVDYLNRVRIGKAKEMLARTNLSVTAVALRTGYSDAAYFSRVFRKATGMSPIEFRRSGTAHKTSE